MFTKHLTEEQKHQRDVLLLEAVTDMLAQMSKPESPEAMATIKQIEANRRNALKSTGPKTTEGKAAAAKNSLKHGLYASTLLLPEEDPAQYEALADMYADHYQPEGLEEIELVEQLITGKWELCRLNLMKQGVYAAARKWLKRNDKPGAETNLTAAHICMEVGRDGDQTKAIARISQMEGRVQRQIERAKRDLHKLQQQRANEPQPAAEPDPPASLEEVTQRPPSVAPPDSKIAGKPESVPPDGLHSDSDLAGS